jgi:hypothetical protein
MEGLRFDVRLVSLSYVYPSLLTRDGYVRRQASLPLSLSRTHACFPPSLPEELRLDGGLVSLSCVFSSRLMREACFRCQTSLSLSVSVTTCLFVKLKQEWWG